LCALCVPVHLYELYMIYDMMMQIMTIAATGPSNRFSRVDVGGTAYRVLVRYKGNETLERTAGIE